MQPVRKNPHGAVHVASFLELVPAARQSMKEQLERSKGTYILLLVDRLDKAGKIHRARDVCLLHLLHDGTSVEFGLGSRFVGLATAEFAL